MSAEHDILQEFAQRRRRAAEQVKTLSEELAALGKLVDTGYVSTKVDEFRKASADLKCLNDKL